MLFEGTIFAIKISISKLFSLFFEFFGMFWFFRSVTISDKCRVLDLEFFQFRLQFIDSFRSNRNALDENVYAFAVIDLQEETENSEPCKIILALIDPADWHGSLILRTISFLVSCDTTECHSVDILPWDFSDENVPDCSTNVICLDFYSQGLSLCESSCDSRFSCP